MKTKIKKAIEKYINDFKDFDEVRLQIESGYLPVLERKNQRRDYYFLLKKACDEYLEDGNFNAYTSDNFNDLVRIFREAGEPFKYEIYLKKPICDEIKKFGFDTWFDKCNNLDSHYEHFKQKGSEYVADIWYRTLISQVLFMMITEEK